MLFLRFRVRLRREPGRQRLTIPKPIRPVPSQQSAERSQELIQRAVEIHGGTSEHPHPQEYQPVQRYVQEVQNRAWKGRNVRRFQVGHRRGLLHDEERGVRQDEGVSGDVVAEPVEAGASAGGFGGEFVFDVVQGEGPVAEAGGVLDVEEGLCEGVPDGGGDGESEHSARQEGHVPTEGGVGQEHEGSEEQQRPAPRDFDKIQVEDIPAAAEIRLWHQLQLLQ